MNETVEVPEDYTLGTDVQRVLTDEVMVDVGRGKLSFKAGDKITISGGRVVKAELPTGEVFKFDHEVHIRERASDDAAERHHQSLSALTAPAVVKAQDKGEDPALIKEAVVPAAVPPAGDDGTPLTPDSKPIPQTAPLGGNIDPPRASSSSKKDDPPKKDTKSDKQSAADKTDEALKEERKEERKAEKDEKADPLRVPAAKVEPKPIPKKK